MAAFEPYPPYTATGEVHGLSVTALPGYEVVSIDQRYDGTVVVRVRRRGYNEPPTVTGGWWVPPTEVATNLRYTHTLPDLRELYPPYEPRRSRFKTRFPGEARAEMPTHVHQQAPRARPRPVQRLQHFASPRVWARRNRPTPPRKESTCQTTT